MSSDGHVVAIGDDQFKVKIEYEGLNYDEIHKLEYASQIFADAISSEKFKDFCLNFSYEEHFYTRRWFRKVHTGSKIHHGFKGTHLTNQQVYDTIMSGKETLSGVIDNTANVYLRVDRRNKRGVVGYTYGNTKWQWVYSWVLRYGPEMLAANASHEWCHKAGFDHAYRWNSTRQYSVPYAIGQFVQEFSE